MGVVAENGAIVTMARDCASAAPNGTCNKRTPSSPVIQVELLHCKDSLTGTSFQHRCSIVLKLCQDRVLRVEALYFDFAHILASR